MKNITLSHNTALKFIRQIRTGYASKDFVKNEETLDILINSNKLKSKSKRLNYHILSSKLPRQSILKFGNISYVCPELLLVQMTSVLDTPLLALLILEFCGTYSINEIEHTFTGNLAPITNITKIKSYIKSLCHLNNKVKGVQNLKGILDYLSDNSASPMESRLYLKLCGPRTKGFYQCANLKMNRRVRISAKAQRIAGQQYIIPDISNIENKVAIEYDSSQFHEESIQGQKDKRRRDALVNDKWKVYTIVPSQINNPETFHIIALNILKDLNQGNRIRMKDFYQRRDASFQLLL